MRNWFAGLLSLVAALCLTAASARAQESVSAEPTLMDGINAYRAGEFETARSILEIYDAQEDPTAQFFLGRMYHDGQGVEADIDRALDYLIASSENGDVNAPVWAAGILQPRNENERAAYFHRMALERGLHVTSMMQMANFHRNSRIANPNQTAAARYFALGTATLDRINVEDPTDYLAGFSCYELLLAVFVETRSQPGNGAATIDEFYPAFFQCAESEDTSELRARLIAAATARLDAFDLAAIDESQTLFSFSDGGGDARASVLPRPFAGRVGFTSDADSDSASASIAMHAYLNDHLGLPIASSIFVSGSGPTIETPSTGDDEDPLVLMSVFNGVDRPNQSPVFGAPNYFNIGRAWHRGRYDHLHSWFSDGETYLMRGPWAISSSPQIPLSELLSRPAERFQQSGLVLRLYLSERPAEDLRIAFQTQEGSTVAVNSAEIVNFQRMELDEGEQRHVIVLTLPGRYPDFFLPAGDVLDQSSIASVQIASPSCAADCAIQLIKIEVNNFDRATAINQARMLRDLRIFPMGFTSHGGEGWHVHGNPAALPAFWDELVSATAVPNVPHRSPTFTTANVEDTKGYIEDVLTEIGVLAVRPQTLYGGRQSNEAIQDWDAPYNHFGIYADKVNFATTHFFDHPPFQAPVEFHYDYFRSRLNVDEDLLQRVCVEGACNISQNNTLPLLIEASFQRAENTDGHFSHLWYTHFGSPTALHEPTVNTPFSADSRAAFERLSASFLGFHADGAPTLDERLYVSSAAEGILSRKLEYILSSGLMRLHVEGDRIIVGDAIDPFLGGLYPDENRVTQDLAMLSYQVEDVFAADFIFNDEPLPVMRRRSGEGEAGEVTIVDSGAAQTLVFAGLDTDASDRTQIPLARSDGGWAGCAVPYQQADIFNARFLSFANPFADAEQSGALEIRVTLRPHSQLSYGIETQALVEHVFTSNPAQVIQTSGVSQTVHRFDLPAEGGRQPARIFAPVFMPAAYRPVSDDGVGLAFAGQVEEVCVRIEGERPADAFGPVEVLQARRDIRSDAIFAPLIGGQLSGDSAASGALMLEAEANGAITVLTASAGYYHGDVPAPGYYRARWISDDCSDSPERLILIQRDRLDLDLTVTGCALSETERR
ncbi:tetratricopeptide repeat protein [Hyphobacterium sp.]|uniref:tetratricopeptide repeat protein n=1 Tax=Hyphobacterium sp. TaxID=2004662 RepID=UPI003BACA7AE